MRYFRAILMMAFSFILPSNVYAIEAFGDLLYWRATENIDWTLDNNLSSRNQNIAYKTIKFDNDTGFRAGVRHEEDEEDWDAKLFYTRFFTSTSDSAIGNLTSTFIGGKLNQAADSFFYQSGQVNFEIDFNMIDANIGKPFDVTDSFQLRPFAGVEGGWINQTVTTSFQGQISGTENTTNNFGGAGPKVGVENRVLILCGEDFHFDWVADFSAAYLWGRWKINDVFHNVNGGTIIVGVDNRNFGSLALQGLMGVNLDYQNLSFKLGYEISDWFNQYQVLDDGTGGHNNDLILQGLTLSLSYGF